MLQRRSICEPNAALFVKAAADCYEWPYLDNAIQYSNGTSSAAREEASTNALDLLSPLDVMVPWSRARGRHAGFALDGCGSGQVGH